MRPYESFINELREKSAVKGEPRAYALQLMELHREASMRSEPVIVELGVEKGQSTRVFLNAIHEKIGAKLVSVDILDYSDAVADPNWEFVKQDSADADALIEEKVYLEQGIDILYVDSLHTSDHVKKEVYGYFRWVKRGGVIFFDDVDSGPYMIGQRKDSVSMEITNRKILNLLEAIFRANMDSIDFSIMRGSSGLAKFVKRTELGDDLITPLYISERRWRLGWRIFEVLSRKVLRQTDKTFITDPREVDSPKS